MRNIKCFFEWGIWIIIYYFLAFSILEFKFYETFTFFPVFYNSIGFRWDVRSGSLFGALIILATGVFLCNSIYRAINNRWPEFHDHDKSSFVQSGIRAVFYFVLAFFAIGAYGARLKWPSVLFTPEFMLLTVVSLIFGGVIFVIEDFLGCIFVFLGKKK